MYVVWRASDAVRTEVCLLSLMSCRANTQAERQGRIFQQAGNGVTSVPGASWPRLNAPMIHRQRRPSNISIATWSHRWGILVV